MFLGEPTRGLLIRDMATGKKGGGYHATRNKDGEGHLKGIRWSAIRDLCENLSEAERTNAARRGEGEEQKEKAYIERRQ